MSFIICIWAINNKMFLCHLMTNYTEDLLYLKGQYKNTVKEGCMAKAV